MNSLDGAAVVGLTGQSGAGKSTVSEIFSDCGLPVIDCDKTARRAADIPEFLSDIKAVFPDGVEDGKLLRQKIGALVFNDRKKLAQYEGIIFPYIVYDIFREIRELKTRSGIVVLDAPTLFESGLNEICSYVISVVAPFDMKLKRILERDGVPVELAKSRLSSQNSEKFFYDRSDAVINNSGSLDELREKALSCARAVKERFNA